MERDIRDDAILDNQSALNRKVNVLGTQLDRIEILVLAVAITTSAHFLYARGVIR